MNKQLIDNEISEAKQLVDNIIKLDLQQFYDFNYTITIIGIDFDNEHNRIYKYSKFNNTLYKQWIVD